MKSSVILIKEYDYDIPLVWYRNDWFCDCFRSSGIIEIANGDEYDKYLFLAGKQKDTLAFFNSLMHNSSQSNYPSKIVFPLKKIVKIGDEEREIKLNCVIGIIDSSTSEYEFKNIMSFSVQQGIEQKKCFYIIWINNDNGGFNYENNSLNIGNQTDTLFSNLDYSTIKELFPEFSGEYLDAKISEIRILDYHCNHRLEFYYHDIKFVGFDRYLPTKYEQKIRETFDKKFHE
jgi:hypothetical protein